MIRCLCCGKTLRKETPSQWHAACIKAFFGTSLLPDIDVSDEVLKKLAVDSTNKGFTVPGVQKKLSLHLSTEETPRLTLVNYPTGYILKPQTEDYPSLPEMEYLVMQMAELCGIKTVPYALVCLPSQNNAFAYITKRIDRDNGQVLAIGNNASGNERSFFGRYDEVRLCGGTLSAERIAADYATARNSAFFKYGKVGAPKLNFVDPSEY